MYELSHFTGVPVPDRDALIVASWKVMVAAVDGADVRVVGHGDEPTWSPDGCVTRTYQREGNIVIEIETATGSEELPFIVGVGSMGWGLFTWKPVAATVGG